MLSKQAVTTSISYRRISWTKRSIPGRRHFRTGADVLPSLISRTSSDFVEKKVALDEAVSDLEEKLSHVRLGGGSRAAERMKAKKKLLPRER